MACATNLVFLPIAATGTGCVRKIVGSPSTITLFKDNAANFPSLTTGKFFYAIIHARCANVIVKVTAVDMTTNQFTVEWVEGQPLSCIPEGSQIVYSLCNQYALQEMIDTSPVNVTSPLVFDCDTRTISVDCAALKAMVNNPCA